MGIRRDVTTWSIATLGRFVGDVADGSLLEIASLGRFMKDQDGSNTEGDKPVSTWSETGKPVSAWSEVGKPSSTWTEKSKP